MMRCRGLTVLEVLIATAILAALAVTCVPLMRSASDVLRESPPQIDLADLTTLADEILSNPEDHGIDFDPDSILQSMIEPIELNWPDHPDRPAVLLHVARSINSEAETPSGTAPDFSVPSTSGVWLVLSCELWQVFRWLPVELPQDSVAPGDGER